MTVTSEKILQFLHLAAGPQTTKAVWQALRRDGVALREDEIGAELAKMAGQGLLRRERSGWRAVVSAPTKPLTTSATNVSSATSACTPSPSSTFTRSNSRQPPRDPAGRWSLLRRLCLYYIECLLYDQSHALRGYLDRHNDTWITVNQSVPWDRLSQNNTGFTFVLSTAARTIQRNRAKAGRENSVFLGYPVEVIRPSGKDPWVLPLFIQPMGADWQPSMMKLEPDGPVSANVAWLESAFRSRDERTGFLNMVGLMPSDEELAEDDEEKLAARIRETPSFAMLATRAADFLPDKVQESILPAALNTSDQWDALTSGIHNRAVLMLGPRISYTRTLIRELRKIARDWSDEDLDKTALTSIFPHDKPAGHAALCQLPQPLGHLRDESVTTRQVLNTEQRQAVTQALRAELSVVTGPPGTGKSEVVRAVMSNQALRGRSVLFASKNHRALDAVVPALNEQFGPNPLVIRASNQDLAMRTSWKRTLREILARPAVDWSDDTLDRKLHSLCDQARAAGRRWHQRHVMARQYEELLAQLQDALAQAEKHAGLADNLQDLIAAWPLERSPEKISEMATRHQRLMQPPLNFLQRLLAWWGKHQTQINLQSLHTEIQAWPQPQAIMAPSIRSQDGCPHPWEWWLAMARSAHATQQVILLERQLRSLPESALLREQWSASLVKTWEIAKALLYRTAAGQHQTLDSETRTQLNNLRAGMANLGETRWERQFREHFPTILRMFPLWAVSNLSVGSALPLVPAAFDLAVLDEASQCDIPSCIPILARARRAMLVGDPRQLRHVTQLDSLTERMLLESHGVTDLDLQGLTYRENSCFELGLKAHDRVQLREHFRCHPHIGEYAGRAFYQQTLEVVTITERLKIPAGRRPGLHWTHVDGPITSAFSGASSDPEILAIVTALRELAAQDFRGTVGVVTPFRQQSNRLSDAVERELAGIIPDHWKLLISTAHGFQGDERDVMFLSLCCGPDMPGGSKAFVVENPNLFNVAVTRGRAILHVFGNRNWAMGCGVGFLEDCAKRSLTVEHAASTAPTSVDQYESPWERVFALALRDAGISTVAQYPVAGRRLDLAVLTPLRLDIEIDGEAFHRTAGGGRKDDDHWRDLQLQGLGWKIQRFWVYQIRDELPTCVTKVRQTLTLDHNSNENP